MPVSFWILSKSWNWFIKGRILPRVCEVQMYMCIGLYRWLKQSCSFTDICETTFFFYCMCEIREAQHMKWCVILANRKTSKMKGCSTWKWRLDWRLYFASFIACKFMIYLRKTYAYADLLNWSLQGLYTIFEC